MKTYIDNREPSNIQSTTSLALNNKNFEHKIKQLAQADFYYPEKDVAIERKTIGDLISSISDGRLSKQADRMNAQHKHNYLIIEGNNLFQYEHSNISSKSITGQLISLAVKRNMKIVRTETVDDTAYTVARIFERYKDEEHLQTTEYLKTHDTGEINNTQTAMLMQIDGISRQKADKILEETRFNSIEHLLTYKNNYEKGGENVPPKTLLQEVDGIGEKTAEKILKSFKQG